MKVSSFHIGIAAEAFAAGQFARFGYNVSVQYGANQPGYDLLVDRDDDDVILRISVKGSKTGSWELISKYKENNTNREAADKWAEAQDSKTIFCLVQFHKVGENELPRMYLALPGDIANTLKSNRKGNGGTILYENHTYKGGLGTGTTDRIPEEWRFLNERIAQLIAKMS